MQEEVQFTIRDYHLDNSFKRAHYLFKGSEETGWEIYRNGSHYLSLSSGYRLMEVERCGICSTDLDKRFLPFPLPQITGHEAIVKDPQGNRYAVEINASHHSRGIDDSCPFCNNGLPTHCPERLVLGIDRLPGGFAPFLLAPIHNLVPLPVTLPLGTAVLIEPFAAALHAVKCIKPGKNSKVGVLGPGKLGMLVLSALACFSKVNSLNLEIVAITRNDHLLSIAKRIGATSSLLVEGIGKNLPSNFADIIIDTTGNPEGLNLAVRLANREVHLKSTTGRITSELHHLTELVVDEISLLPFSDSGEIIEYHLHKYYPNQKKPPSIAWLSHSTIPNCLVQGFNVIRGSSPREVFDKLENDAYNPLQRVDCAFVDSQEMLDTVIRPNCSRENSFIRPRGVIFVKRNAKNISSPLLQAISQRGMTLSTSRCGSFKDAIGFLERIPHLKTLGDEMITQIFSIDRIEEAFQVARSRSCIKAVVENRAT